MLLLIATKTCFSSICWRVPLIWLVTRLAFGSTRFARATLCPGHGSRCDFSAGSPAQVTDAVLSSEPVGHCSCASGACRNCGRGVDFGVTNESSVLRPRPRPRASEQPEPAYFLVSSTRRSRAVVIVLRLVMEQDQPATAAFRGQDQPPAAGSSDPIRPGLG